MEPLSKTGLYWKRKQYGQILSLFSQLIAILTVCFMNTPVGQQANHLTCGGAKKLCAPGMRYLRPGGAVGMGLVAMIVGVILGGQLVTPVSQKKPPFWVWNGV